MKITTNVAEVIRQLKAYEKSLEDRLHDLMDRLAQIGINTANTRYMQAQYDGSKDDYPTGPAWISDTTLEIGYEGSTILFIEFGTGVHYSEQHELASEFGYTRGGYGYHLGKLDSWRYIGDPGTNGEPDEKHPGYIRTHGNPPNRVMYQASKDMQEQILKIAKEVFA